MPDQNCCINKQSACLLQRFVRHATMRLASVVCTRYTIPFFIKNNSSSSLLSTILCFGVATQSPYLPILRTNRVVNKFKKYILEFYISEQNTLYSQTHEILFCSFKKKHWRSHFQSHENILSEESPKPPTIRTNRKISTTENLIGSKDNTKTRIYKHLCIPLLSV